MVDRVFDPKEMRRALWWAIPFCLGLVAFFLFFVIEGMIPDIEDLFSLAPTVRITPGGIIALPIIIFFLLLPVMGIMRAIPVDTRYCNSLEKFMMKFVYLIILCLAVIGFSPLIQSAVMPDLGYTKCNILEGHPNLYYSDWVRNPAWCVKGKSREWVREQAAASQNNQSAGSQTAPAL